MRKEILVIVCLFLLAQLFGLFVCDYYKHNNYPFGFKPSNKLGFFDVVIFVLFIFLVSILFLFLFRFRSKLIWKFFYGLSIWFAFVVALYPFFDIFAVVTSIVFVILKLLGGDETFNNITEIIVYGGVTAIMFPMFSKFTALFLLLLISVYDYFGVSITKHIIKLAKNQMKFDIFSGFSLKRREKEIILGGGDVVFPLIFASMFDFGFGVVIALCSTMLLFVLFLLGKKGKYYPAMPFLSFGCLIGYFLILLSS